MRITTIFGRSLLAGAALALAGTLGAAAADELPSMTQKKIERETAVKTAQAGSPAASATAVPAAIAGKAADGRSMRIVVVEWKIKKGREQEFLDYWATRSTIPNRDGLIAEFLSNVDSKEKWPWINWAGPIDKPGITTYYNVGMWRDGDAFQDQIGKYIDNNRPPLDFEDPGIRRSRVFLAPALWRVGQTGLPRKDSDGTK